MEVEAVLIGILGSAALGLVGYIAHRVDQLSDRMGAMMERLASLEGMRREEHQQWEENGGATHRRPGPGKYPRRS